MSPRCTTGRCGRGPRAWCGLRDGPASWPGATGSGRPGGGPGALRTVRSRAGWGSPSPRCSAAWARPPCRSSCPAAGRKMSPRRRSPSPGCRQASRNPKPRPRRPGRRRRSRKRYLRRPGPGPRPQAVWPARADASPRPAPEPGWPASPAGRRRAGMRGRCWRMPGWTGSARRRSWPRRCRPARPGRADTVVTDYHGRAVAFATGEPSGLAATLPPVLAQLRQVTGEQAKILLGFDRGGSYPVAFRAVRDQRADWVTWRRGKLAPVTAAPRRYRAARGDGKPAEVLHLADETVAIKDYGQARQITLFEGGVPVLQVLTSDTDAPAAALLAWLRCRWRIENLFKYLEDNYGIHWLCDYHAEAKDDDHLIGNPERTAARARLRE